MNFHLLTSAKQRGKVKELVKEASSPQGKILHSKWQYPNTANSSFLNKNPSPMPSSLPRSRTQHFESSMDNPRRGDARNHSRTVEAGKKDPSTGRRCWCTTDRVPKHQQKTEGPDYQREGEQKPSTFQYTASRVRDYLSSKVGRYVM